MYSYTVVRTLRTLLLDNPDDTSKDAEILSMPKLEIFEKCLNHEGIVGFSGIIIGFVTGIWGVTLEPKLDAGDYIEPEDLS